ncbi:spc7 kinetochore protein [Hirsutella rhossiliensis]|uniref:Spc7 kinetochore protein n=1 Tax=Hirsutella rhossiliensis TaxID=111463 RepID=A0A9P8SH25_9HYPO|nr:spc7 kinetochore protein [Hirsutella rhossiliensis]KAH0962416.1 spc7 kinetochore protein [Hirsutella rhossiliensis]
MPSSADRTLPLARRSRKSIGAQPAARDAMDKENATVDVGSSLAASRKSRSKSMGPGGLDALKQSAGNRRASLAAPVKPPRSILKPSISSLPEIPPLKNGNRKPGAASDARDPTPGSSLSSEDLLGSKLPLRTEEEQQAAAKEREERDRRDARRKSLANRRVSFAAEATLHTFHEVEYMQDSTSSTDSTRRASSGAKSPSRSSATATREETHPSQPENIPRSPEDQRELQQRRRRRSSGIPPMNFSNAHDDTLASTVYSSDSEPADAVEEIAEDDDEASSSDSDDGTMMTIDTEEVTGTSVASDRSTATAEDSTLDEALRIAAQRAGAGSHENDEGEDSDDGEEVIPSFGWEEQDDETEMEMDIDADMDMTHAVGRILKPPSTHGTDPRGDMSMDVTQAFGAILSQNRAQDPDDVEDHEDMSMELTTIIGGVLSKPRDSRAAASRRQSLSRLAEADVDDAAMDMTVSVGRIMSATSPESKEDANATTGMDITTAIGGIIKNGEMTPRTLNKRIMEEEVDGPDSPRRAIIAAVTQQSPSRRSSRILQTTEKASLESPGLSAFQGKGLRRSLGPPTQTTPQSGARSRTLSPSKTKTPQRQPASTKNPETGKQSPKPLSASPEKPSPASEKKTPSPAKATQQRGSFFRRNPETGDKTPTVVLTPPKRRLSGVGIDRPGLGSPQVAALCDRRGSISKLASVFVPGKRAVAFEEPKEVEKEIDRERRDEEDKENRRKILEREADGSQEDRDATFNLREMINSLSPKWKPLRGRKSLHIGSAKGLLGKRPAELEGDDEAEDNDGVKRLKGHQSSPVKNVRLQQPPSNSETTGRLTRSARRSPEQAPAATSQNQGRFKDVGDSPSVHEVNFHDLSVKDDAELEREVDEDKIHLQDFLNMTSIRFMELTTTKRRHTIAPGTREDGSAADGQDDLSLECCVVAGACTVPLLELYQHSCRELKQYISEGRRMVKEIENETFEENPPLFREYMSATPEVKALMDNQFKNVKTHARLLSKAMWYEWRMKLQDGLKEGLVNIAEGMESDSKLLQEQQDLLTSVLPALAARYESLQEEEGNLQAVAREMADCDPAELESARQELEALEEDVAIKKQQIAELRQHFETSAAEVEDLSLKKTKCMEEMNKSEKIREKYRGWTSREVNALKARVEAIEKQHGWAVTGLSGSNLSMTYKRDIELVVDIASMQPGGPNSPMDLWYIADARENDPVPRTTEKEIWLQSMRHHARALQQSGAKMSDLIGEVQAGWDKALLVSSQISRINVVFPTTVAKTSDSSISVTSSLLLVPLRTKVEVRLLLRSCSGQAGIDVGISAEAKVVYGEHFNVGKIEDFLLTRIGNTVKKEKSEDWSDVFVELRRRLIARGKK